MPGRGRASCKRPVVHAARWLTAAWACAFCSYCPHLLQRSVTAAGAFRDMDFPVGVTYRADVDSCGSEWQYKLSLPTVGRAAEGGVRAGDCSTGCSAGGSAQMRLTKSTSHAMRILIDCARAHDQLIKVAELSERLEITQQNVFKIVSLLARAGLIDAVRG